MNIDTSQFIPTDRIDTSDVEDKDEVIQLVEEAEGYLKSQKWCSSIKNGWYAVGWGYMLGVFYYEIIPNGDADSSVWVVVGDLPTAYIDIESANDEIEVILSYVELMEDWIENVENGNSVEDCFPINVSPTREHAAMLRDRTKLIREEILAAYDN